MLAYARLLRWQSSGFLDPLAAKTVTGNRVESRARALRSCSCLCKASPSRPGRLLSCLLVDIPQPFMFDRGPHLKLAVVVLLAWRDGALNVSPVAKLRAQQSPRRTAAHSTDDRVRRKTVSALVHFFCAFSLFLFVRLFFSVFFSVYICLFAPDGQRVRVQVLKYSQ